MKKLLNDPDLFVDEMLEGLLLAHPDALKFASEDKRAVVRADAPVDGKVGIVTGGGSGHLPVFVGYVGPGLCSGAAIGNVFSSPSSEQMLATTRAVSGGAGVLYLYGNYDGEMEIGIGIHGEPGVHRGPLESADAVTERLVGSISDDLALKAGDRVSVLVNGLGATPLEELYILYRRAAHLLGELGVEIHRPYVGEYATSLEMAGASISVMRLDDALTELLDAPARSPFFRQ